MANPTWPPAPFPQFVLAEGYGESPKRLGIRTVVDQGPAKQRRRVTNNVAPMRYTLRLRTSADVDTFKSFWEVDLAGGSLRFDWIHPRTKAAVTMRFVNTQDVQIGAINRGMQYSVPLQLELMP